MLSFCRISIPGNSVLRGVILSAIIYTDGCWRGRSCKSLSETSSSSWSALAHLHQSVGLIDSQILGYIDKSPFHKGTLLRSSKVRIRCNEHWPHHIESANSNHFRIAAASGLRFSCESFVWTPFPSQEVRNAGNNTVDQLNTAPTCVWVAGGKGLFRTLWVFGYRRYRNTSILILWLFAFRIFLETGVEC